MKAPALAAAFVAGVFLVQQLRDLPGAVALGACAAVAALASVLAVVLAVVLVSKREGRRRESSAGAFAADARSWPSNVVVDAKKLGIAASVILALLAAVCGGVAYAGWRAALRVAEAFDRADEGRDLRVVGVVATMPAEYERAVRFEFQVERAWAGSRERPQPVRVPARISLGWTGAPETLLAAQRWELGVRLKRPHATANPAGFDLEELLFERDLRALGSVRGGTEEARLLDERVADAWALVDRARQVLRTRLHRALQGCRYAPVLIALAIGDQAGIGTADWALFNRTGIGHLISISGLHVTMLAGLGAQLGAAAWRRSGRLLRLAPLPVARAVAGAATAFAYCMLAGWGVPAQRTFVMLSTFAVATALRSQVSGPGALAASAVAVVLLDPWCVVSAGFWLSFGAVATILFAMQGRVVHAAPGWRDRLSVAVRVQWTVTLGLVPATILIFQQVSLVSPLANAIAIPAVSIVIAPLALAGTAALLLPSPLSVVGDWSLAAAERLFAWLAAGLEPLAASPLASVAVSAPPAWTVPIAVAGLAWWIAPPGWPLRAAGVIGMLPMLAWPRASPAPTELWVTALDVGQGMALVVESGGHALLFDAGPSFSPEADAGARVVVPYLRWRGIARLDLVVISHLDNDHSGGARAVLSSVTTGALWTSIDARDPVLAGGPAALRCEAGQQARYGPLRVEVLQPPAGSYERRLSTNQRSCVLRVEAAGRSVLLTGDVPVREERAFVAAGRLRPVDLLVAPHHGSHTSSSETLIAAAQPRWVSIQAGYRSRFGHPHPSVLLRYERLGVHVVRSDRDGAVTWRLRADGADEVEGWRESHASYWNDQPQDPPGLAASARLADAGGAADDAEADSGGPDGLPGAAYGLPGPPGPPGSRGARDQGNGAGAGSSAPDDASAVPEWLPGV